MSPHEMRNESPVETPEVPQIHVGSGEENLEVPASNPEEDLGLGSDCRGIPRSLLANVVETLIS